MTLSTELLQHWLLTYAIHSTLLLGAAALIDWQVLRGRAHLQELLWKSVLVGALASTTLQVATGSSGVLSFSLAHSPAAQVGAETVSVLSLATVKPTASVATVPAALPLATPQPIKQNNAGWLGLWLLGVALMLARLQVSAFRLRIILRERRPFPPAQRPRSMPSWVRVSVCANVSQPIAVGLREICVPKVLLAMPQPRIDAALAHEWAHLQRGDGVWRWICLLTRSVLYFQPLNLLASRAIARAAEQCSDELALKNGTRTADLVDALACFALRTQRPSNSRFPATPELASAMLGRPHEVVTRIENLVHGRLRAAPKQRWVVAATFTLSLAAGLALPGISISETRTTRTSVEVQEFASGQGTLMDVKGQKNGAEKINMKHQSKGLEIILKTRGPFAFDAAEQQLITLDGYFDIRVKEQGSNKRIRFDGADGVIMHDFWIDGVKQPYRPEGYAWFASQLPRLFRLSGLHATTRAQRIYDSGGIGALVSEASLVKGDHARRLYLAAVADRSLTPSEISQLLSTSRQILGSDVEKRLLLTRLAKYQAGQLNWPEYVSTSQAIGSDVEQREALKAILGALPSQPELASLYAKATRAIDSDVEQSFALQALMSQPTFTAQSVRPVMHAARHIQSDGEHRALLEKLLETQMVTDAQAKEMVAQVAVEIQSQQEREALIETLAQRHGQAAQALKALDGSQGQRKSQRK